MDNSRLIYGNYTLRRRQKNNPICGYETPAFFPRFALKAAARHPEGWRFRSAAEKELWLRRTYFR